MTSRLPLTRPIRIADEFETAVFEDVDVPLHALMAACISRGVSMIQGRTFRGCRLLGPAIVLVGAATTFDDTNFGDGRGQVGNLLLRPVGDKAIGAIPLVQCAFEGCEFREVGFTGGEDFLKAVLELDQTPRFGRLS